MEEKDSPTYLFWQYELALSKGQISNALQIAKKLKGNGFFIRRLAKGGANLAHRAHHAEKIKNQGKS
ncbi:MAG TPA: hypothetical protein VKX17_12010 [Planctomycetota bacterium]|nr:hypothetical protein [Planctomycetota bacterium]